MDKFLPFVTIDIWTLVFTWINLILLFFLMKRFFFSPIKEILKKRDDEITHMYDEAEDNRTNARNLKHNYEEKLLSVDKKAKSIIDAATKNAQQKSDIIISEAKTSAKNMIDRAESQIADERKKSFSKMKSDISDISVQIAEKLLERNLSDKDHTKIINKMIDELGDM